MADTTVLRTTKIGNGFVKEDVMQYLDELNTKIDDLVKENEKLKKAGPSESSEDEIRKYKNQVENLQEKLNNSNNLLRAKNKELETAKATIAQLQAGKPVPAGAVPTVDTAQLDVAKKEIENLKNQLKIAQSAPKSPVAQPAGNNDSAELAKVKQDLAKMSGELAVRARAVDEKNREISARDAKIAQLTKENAVALAKKDEEIAKKNAELAAKDVEIKNASEKANNPALMASAMLVGAQEIADKTKADAKAEAEKTVNDAKAIAEKTISEAKAEAEKVVKDAKSNAEKTISAANTTAESCIKDANIKAKTTIDEANRHADTVNEMSATVRKMLINEIENISSKFSDLGSRITEAKDVVSEARKSIDTNASQDIKKMEAPKVDMSDVKTNAEKIKTPAPAPKAPEKTAEINSVKPDNSAKSANNIKPAYVQAQPQPKKSVVGMGDMDDIMKSFSVKPTVETPAPVPVQSKPQPKKPVNSLMGDDMADLLKAIEADPNNLGE